MKERYFVEDESDDWGSFATVYRIDGDEKVEVGWIGGEPEDNTYYRTYSWIVGALNEAYELGYKAGKIAERLGFDI